MELNEQQGDNSQSEKDDNEDIECYVKKMNAFKDNIFKKAKDNIVDAQIRQKCDYDKKHGKKKVYSLVVYWLIKNELRKAG